MKHTTIPADKLSWDKDVQNSIRNNGDGSPSTAHLSSIESTTFPSPGLLVEDIAMRFSLQTYVLVASVWLHASHSLGVWTAANFSAGSRVVVEGQTDGEVESLVEDKVHQPLTQVVRDEFNHTSIGGRQISAFSMYAGTFNGLVGSSRLEYGFAVDGPLTQPVQNEHFAYSTTITQQLQGEVRLPPEYVSQGVNFILTGTVSGSDVVYVRFASNTTFFGQVIEEWTFDSPGEFHDIHRLSHPGSEVGGFISCFGDVNVTIDIQRSANSTGRTVVGGFGFHSGVNNPAIGDYNGNGEVDSADYSVWRDSLEGTILRNETASLGVVDLEDYDVWKSNFGFKHPGMGAATPLPEPTTMSWLLATLLLVSRFTHSRVRV